MDRHLEFFANFAPSFHGSRRFPGTYWKSGANVKMLIILLKFPSGKPKKGWGCFPGIITFLVPVDGSDSPN